MVAEPKKVSTKNAVLMEAAFAAIKTLRKPEVQAQIGDAVGAVADGLKNLKQRRASKTVIDVSSTETRPPDTTRSQGTGGTAPSQEKSRRSAEVAHAVRPQEA